MKTKKIAAFYRKTNISSLKIKWYALLGYEIYEWADPSAKRMIPFPESAQWTPIMLDARKRLANYFEDYVRHYPDIYVYDYVRKTFDLVIADYCAFRYSVEAHLAPLAKVKIVGPFYLASIYTHKRPAVNLLFLITQFAGFAKFLKHTAVALYVCVKFKGDIAPPHVLFLRKKAYPDLSVSETLGDMIRAQGVSYAGAFLLFGTAKEKYGFYYLNAFRGVFACVLRASVAVLKKIPSDAVFFLRYKLPLAIFSSLLTDSLTVATVSEFQVPIMTGALVDKPIFVLLSRYKNRDQKIAGINEFFCFFPYRGFDYNHLDVYYSMNEIDAKLQNTHGGYIARVQYTPFFRNYHKTNSEGLSTDLTQLITQFERTVIATTTQIASTVYSQWSTHDVGRFFKAMVQLAENTPTTLFIIKGKKGELRSVPDEFIGRAEVLKNIYIIHSDVPRSLKHNQFEDILKRADVLISMAFLSTTIWQALAADIPAIAVNDVHPPSFLREFPNLEVSLKELPKAFEYWSSINKEEWVRFKDLVSREINLTGENGLQIIADDIVSLFRI
ncbi:MAG: hypothetical protein Q7S48_03090 [bacterium]|nr:hypothetical protein [bacterium]